MAFISSERICYVNLPGRPISSAGVGPPRFFIWLGEDAPALLLLLLMMLEGVLTLIFIAFGEDLITPVPVVPVPVPVPTPP